jgi:hypothetical protein
MLAKDHVYAIRVICVDGETYGSLATAVEDREIRVSVLDKI